MRILHEKSPCCRGIIRRFGGRRRQCQDCKATWSVWKKKKGRNPLRNNLALLKRYLGGDVSVQMREAQGHGINAATLSARLRNARDAFCARTPWPALPPESEPLILVADALIQPMDGISWTVYLLFVRSLTSTEAVILPPYIRRGSEHGHGGWKAAFDQIPESVKSRVVALVSDGATEAISYARAKGWFVQRCHFHLLARIANYVRPGPLSRHSALAKIIYPPIYIVLRDPSAQEVNQAVRALDDALFLVHSPGLKTALSGFVKHYNDYRTYLVTPEYHLPTTTNSAEAFNSLVRSLLFRARGFRTISSFKAWLEAFCKHKQTIACNGKNQQH